MKHLVVALLTLFCCYPGMPGAADFPANHRPLDLQRLDVAANPRQVPTDVAEAIARLAATPSLTIRQATPFFIALPESRAFSAGAKKSLPPGEYTLRAPPLRLDEPWVFVSLLDPPPELAGEHLGYLAVGEEQWHTSPPFAALRTPRAGLVKRLAAGLGPRLLAVTSSPEAYRRRKTSLLGWFGQTRNGCVAFLSTLMRAAGLPIPMRAVIDGDPVSLDTRPFVRYLEHELGFARVDDLSKALPGDIGVTADHADFPGFPAHVYLFAGWHDESRLIAKVIDNQGFRHPRNVHGDPTWDYGPTSYFLRPPRSGDDGSAMR
jgi:hypothetical protein